MIETQHEIVLHTFTTDTDIDRSDTQKYIKQWRSQKFVMEGVQNRGHVGAGEGGVSREGVSSHKIFDTLVIASLNFAEFCVAEFDIYCTSKQ